MTNIKIMMRRLLDDHDARPEERSRRLHLDQKRAIETAIAQHVQPLNAAIAQERTARVQAVTEEHQQIPGLHEEFKVFQINSKQLPPREGRGQGDEVEIEGFGMKSKDGAIQMVEKVIEGKEGNPQIIGSSQSCDTS